MSKLIDLTGKRFGRLTVEGRAENKSGHTAWNCKCDCGNTCVVQGYLLTKAKTRSCGCLQQETRKSMHVIHKMSETKIYRAWVEMKRRCSNPNCDAYARYGGRGIKICKEWSENFQTFYDYVSKLPHYGEKGYSLDRIDDNGNYEPCNVRYASAKLQASNTRRNITVEYNGEQMTLSQAAELSGIKIQTLWRRYKHGDTGEYLFRSVR